MSSHRMSRRELALVAAALLLPVPMIAESGLSMPVPGAVKHGFGPLITLDADRDGTETTASSTVAESAASPSRSGSASLSMARTRHRSTRSRAALLDRGIGTTSASGPSRGSSSTADAETPKGGGDTDDTGSSVDHGGTDRPTSPGGTGTPRDGSGGARQFEPNRMPSVDLHAAGQGTTSGVSVNADGVDIDVAADSGGAGSEESTGLGVAVADTAGSQTGLDIAIR
jgi:hypothetical protein